MNQVKKILNKAIVLFISITISTSCAQTSTEYIKKVNGESISTLKLDKEIQKIMDSINIAGISIAIINDSKVAYHRTFGFANMETKEKIAKEHIFEGASLSKPIFAYFAMKMVDKGVLNLDKPLYEYLPHAEIAEVSKEDYKIITARMVLSHSSGFPNHRKGKKITLPFKPGNDFLYSGEGYQYLTTVLGELNGVGWKEKFNEIFKNEVTIPLEMKNTSFLWNNHLAKNKVYGHAEGKPTHNYTGKWWNGKTFDSYSSIHSEALEYSKFIIAMLKKEGLSKNKYNEMLKLQNVFNPSNQLLKETGQIGWGLGFAQKPTINGLMHLHTGNNHDFQAYAMFVPKQEYGLVAFTNSDKMLPFLKQLGTIIEEQF